MNSLSLSARSTYSADLVVYAAVQAVRAYRSDHDPAPGRFTDRPPYSGLSPAAARLPLELTVTLTTNGTADTVSATTTDEADRVLNALEKVVHGLEGTDHLTGTNARTLRLDLVLNLPDPFAPAVQALGEFDAPAFSTVALTACQSSITAYS